MSPPRNDGLEKKFPWLSLLLLLVSYITVSWQMFHISLNWQQFAWLYLTMFTVALAGVLTATAKSYRGRFLTWSVSHAWTLITVLTIGFISLMVLILSKIFVHFLVLTAAMILARLDMQTARLKLLYMFILLILVPFAGIILGWELHRISLSFRF